MNREECKAEALRLLEQSKTSYHPERLIAKAQVYATLATMDEPVVYKTEFTGGLDQMDR